PAWSHVRIARIGSFSCQRARLSPDNCGHRIPTGAIQSSGDRVLSNDVPRLRIEISHRARAAQGLAGSTANGAVALRNRHPGEPYAKLRRAAFHEARSRSCEALGKAKMIEALARPGCLCGLRGLSLRLSGVLP